MDKKENKSELIHIRIEPDIKEQSENIFKDLGISTSYAVSMFLKQVIYNEGLPFSVELPKKDDVVIKKNKMLIELYANGTLDYESTMMAIKKNIEGNKND